MRAFWHFSLILIALIAIVYFSFDDLCANTVQSEIVSPNGFNKAVVFERDCGATTDFVTQVSVLKLKDTLENEGGNVFSASLENKKINNNQDEIVNVRWLNDRLLEIEYDEQAKLINKNIKINNIEIKYTKINQQITSGLADE